MKISTGWNTWILLISFYDLFVDWFICILLVIILAKLVPSLSHFWAKSCREFMGQVKRVLGMGVKGNFTHETECPWPLHFQHSSLVEKAEPVQVHFTLRLRNQQSYVNARWMLKSTWIDSYVASNNSCFMVTWIVFKKHLLEVGLTQNQETMVLRMLTTVNLFYFIMCEDPHEEKFIEIAFGWGPGHIWLHNTLEGPCPHCMILEVTWDDDGLCTLSFGLSQFHGHGSWLMCEVALNVISTR